MLSRSSSAYQPLDSERGPANTVVGDIESEGGGGVGGGGNGTEGNNRNNAHEMTNIAVISQHPFRAASGGTPTITTVPLSGTLGTNLHHEDFSMCSNEEKASWTNFHFIMCIGIVGFFVFWIVLLCRMYLPSQFQFWFYGEEDEGGGGGEVDPGGTQFFSDDQSAINT